MDQIVSCRDDIAQQYLMQAVIQGFPDEFHLGTLPSLLSAVGKLQPGVKIHTVLSSLLDRLARHARHPGNPQHACHRTLCGVVPRSAQT